MIVFVTNISFWLDCNPTAAQMGPAHLLMFFVVDSLRIL